MPYNALPEISLLSLLALPAVISVKLAPEIVLNSFGSIQAEPVTLTYFSKQ